ncbi:putative NOT transcription complex subunit VIP2 [Vitis vinifera]|uniref:Putative NOT transcription complex subunit VIP2 n=1 Tax=Vitis vinifera TaxID=29760 RepID=A0A438BZH6_VITVI|nr:putative NOT transcription complex subunit VIP2 [Vitis vinifera]
MEPSNSVPPVSFLSGLNGSSSNLPDTTGRSFTTSFSAQSGSAAAFNHLAIFLLMQLSHASSHGHPGVTNRGGSGVSPMLGNTGPRITSSIGNLAGGGNIGRSLSSGGGLAMPGLASHLSLISNGSGIWVYKDLTD